MMIRQPDLSPTFPVSFPFRRALFVTRVAATVKTPAHTSDLLSLSLVANIPEKRVIDSGNETTLS